MKTCKNCKTENEDDVCCCKFCNYPIGGTEQEQSKFIAKQIIDRREVEEASKKVRNARIILFLIFAYLFLGPFVSYLIEGMSITVFLSIILSGLTGLVFLFFAFFSLKKPKISILIPLILIILNYLCIFIFQPSVLFEGIIWKILILGGLIYAYIGVNNADKILKENKYLAYQIGLSKK